MKDLLLEKIFELYYAAIDNKIITLIVCICFGGIVWWWYHYIPQVLKTTDTIETSMDVREIQNEQVDAEDSMLEEISVSTWTESIKQEEIDDMEDVGKGETCCFMDVPTSKLFSDGVHQDHATIGVGGDHRIADAVKGDGELFFLCRKGTLVLFLVSDIGSYFQAHDAPVDPTDGAIHDVVPTLVSGVMKFPGMDTGRLPLCVNQ